MITDWQIQSFSRKCAHSDKTFQPGDEVLCLLIDKIGEGLSRIDVLNEYADQVAPEGEIVGRWTRVIKPPNSSESEEQKQAVQSAEDLFISMAESVDVAIRSNSSKCMIYILAIYLERKRILRSIPMSGIPQHYLNFQHRKTKTDYLVEQVEMTPENIAHIENNLSILTGESETSETDSSDNES